jgi:hypothetical protein
VYLCWFVISNPPPPPPPPPDSGAFRTLPAAEPTSGLPPSSPVPSSPRFPV